jgi:nucleotide-binding universal stress UspA family protein
MFEKIVVATDLSPASDRLISCLQGLRPFGAREAILVHALGIRHLEAMKYELARLVEPRLAEQKVQLEAHGFKTDTRIAIGPPPLEVDRVAKAEGASLVVVGSHGGTLAFEMPLGSCAHALIHHATLPTLVVRMRMIDKETPGRCEGLCIDLSKSILFPTDFSDNAERAFAYVGKMAEAGVHQITILHVQDKERIEPHLRDRLEEFNAIDRARLDRLATSLRSRTTATVDIEIAYDSPIQEIVNRANEQADTMIVMGSQGRGRIPEMFLGSISHQVVRLAEVPVLLVPAVAPTP